MRSKLMFLTIFPGVCWFVLAAVTCFSTSLWAQNSTPFVSDLQAQQRAGTKLVDITYNVADPDGDLLTIMVSVSNDGGDTFTVPVGTFTGDAGSGITPGIGKHIVWDAGADVPGVYGESYQVKVTADDIEHPNMVMIPAGEFEMGDTTGSYNARTARPVHTVYLDAYYIDAYEVTNAMYKVFTDATGHRDPKIPTGWWHPDFGAPDHAVLGVSWLDVIAYAEWAGKRLPTEAEWEKAARGGLEGNIFPWGDGISHDNANYSGTDGGDVWTYTSPVGSFAPNGYGLYDVAGNAWEWCSDLYGENYYLNSPRENPQGPDSGSYRVLRGGAWQNFSEFTLEVAYRSIGAYWVQYEHTGFRCVEHIDAVPDMGNLFVLDTRAVFVELLNPDPNPENSKIMEGGIAYRYYHLYYNTCEGDNAGKSASGVVPTLEINGLEVVVEASGDYGLLKLAVDTDGIASSGDVLTVKLVKLDERVLSLTEEIEPLIEFQVEVTPRGYTTYWENGTKVGGKFGLSVGGNGYVKGKKETGMSIGLVEPDPGSVLKDEIVMSRRGSNALGVGGGVETPGAKFNIGGVIKGKAKAEANAEIMAGIIKEDAYNFKNPYLSSQKMGQAALFLHQMSQLGGQIDPFMAMIITKMMEESTAEYYSNYLSSQMVGLSAQATGTASRALKLGFGFGPENNNDEMLLGINIGDNAGVAIAASGQYLKYYEGQTLTGTGMILDQFVDVHLSNISFQVGAFFDNGDVGGSLGIQWKPLKAWDAKIVKRFVERLKWDTDGNLIEIELSIVGTQEKQTFTVRGEENIMVVKEAAINLKDLAAAMSNPLSTVSTGGAIINQELSDFLAKVAEIEADYEITRTPTSTVTVPFSLEVSLEIKVGGEFEVTWSKHVDSVSEKGRIINGWQLPFEKYETPPQSDASLIDVTQNALTGAWGIVKDKFNRVAFEVIGGVGVVFDVVGSLDSRIVVIGEMMESGQIDLWTWMNLTDSLVESNNIMAFGGDEYAQTLQLATSPVIGANYQFSPEGAQLASPGTLRIDYSDEQVQSYGVDEGELRISWWDPENSHWVGLPSVVDVINNTVTASVSELHLFAITFDITPPVIDQLTPAPDSTASIQGLVIQAHIQDDIDQLDVSSIELLLDGEQVVYSFEDGLLSYAPVDISVGKHSATVRASDLFGNSAEEIWSFTVALFGDINLSGEVDGEDFAVFAVSWKTRSGDPNWNPNCDLQSDGAINFSDLIVLTDNWMIGK